MIIPFPNSHPAGGITIGHNDYWRYHAVYWSWDRGFESGLIEDCFPFAWPPWFPHSPWAGDGCRARVRVHEKQVSKSPDGTYAVTLIHLIGKKINIFAQDSNDFNLFPTIFWMCHSPQRNRCVQRTCLRLITTVINAAYSTLYLRIGYIGDIR